MVPAVAPFRNKSSLVYYISNIANDFSQAIMFDQHVVKYSLKRLSFLWFPVKYI